MIRISFNKISLANVLRIDCVGARWELGTQVQAYGNNSGEGGGSLGD